MPTNLLLFALFVFCMILMSLNLTRKKKKVIFYGTNVNNLDVVSGGYIAWVTELMKEEGVEDDYQLTHSITPGDKIDDLYNRLNNSLLIKDATIAVIYPGLNDVLEENLNTTASDGGHYEETLQTIIDRIKVVNTKVVLCTPLAVTEHSKANLVADVQMHVEAIKHIALDPDIVLVDLNQLAVNNLSVMPQQNINQLVAIEIWRAMKEMK